MARRDPVDGATQEGVEVRQQVVREDRDDERGSKESVQSRLIVREAAWAILVWYVLAWSVGLFQGTAFDVATVPWSDLWADGVAAIASIPDLVRR